ncbi:hypothetical protein CPAV1605_399 [seawater metagenome]|uniref:ShKT domain-containing protein n=1 Tax=seawater metagenome TaxID=1561972 RepID=A0A5E8CJ34_9ZZZZ
MEMQNCTNWILILAAIFIIIALNQKNNLENMDNTTCKDIGGLALHYPRANLTCKEVAQTAACDYNNIPGYPDHQKVRAMCPIACRVKNPKDIVNTGWIKNQNCYTAKKAGACDRQIPGYPSPEILKQNCASVCNKETTQWENDVMSLCQKAKEAGACEKDVDGYPKASMVKELCKNSCQKKETWNKKVKLSCQDAKNAGACKTQQSGFPKPEFVRAYCPETCDVTDLQDVSDPEWVSKARKVPVSCRELSLDTGKCTVSLRDNSDTKFYPPLDEIRTKCKKSCGMCENPQDKVTCKYPNQNVYCDSWARDKDAPQCVKNPKYMLEKNTCNCACSVWCNKEVLNNGKYKDWCLKQKQNGKLEYPAN